MHARLAARRFQVHRARHADGYTRRLPLHVKMVDEAAFVGVFPNRQARTGRAPGLDHFSIGTWMRADPFKEIEDQGVYWVGHDDLRYFLGQVSFGNAYSLPSILAENDVTFFLPASCFTFMKIRL